MASPVRDPKDNPGTQSNMEVDYVITYRFAETGMWHFLWDRSHPARLIIPQVKQTLQQSLRTSFELSTLWVSLPKCATEPTNPS